MKEIYDPVYYPPSIQGFDDYRQQQHLQQQSQQYNHHLHQQRQRLLKASPSRSTSSSPSRATSVLGRFLKLGKSRSDVAGGYVPGLRTGSAPPATTTTSTSTSSIRNHPGEDYEVDQEFRLSPSVVSGRRRAPVEKMVHKANCRKDVSRSHSWIYGSVKLPQDLPFGYAEGFNLDDEQFDDGGDDGDDRGGGLSGGCASEHCDNNNMEEVYRSGGGGGGGMGGGHYLGHGLPPHAMQIPRCQLDYYAAASAACTCECDDFETMMMMGGQGGRAMMGGSVRGGMMMNSPPRMRGGGNNNNKPPCQACAREMALKYGLPPGLKRKSGSETESFVSSVRKLTWKSLKQVVKKRPSLDTLKKGGGGGMPPSEYLTPAAVFLGASSAPQSPHHGGDVKNPMANLGKIRDNNNIHNNSHYGAPKLSASNSAMSPQRGMGSPSGVGGPEEPQHHPNYFFPEKKSSFYASCNDIYGGEPPPHVTASVRLRPKPTRQPYQFPSEFGPVPNYEEDAQSAYHSEWDLRQVMSYDVWMTTTSNVKPRTGTGTATTAVGPSSGGSSNSGSSKSSSKTLTSSSQQQVVEVERHYHQGGGGGGGAVLLQLPPPDYNTSSPEQTITTFRPPERRNNGGEKGGGKSSSSSSISHASSTKTSTTPSSKSPSSRAASVTSLMSSGSVAGSRQRGSSSSASDTLSISSFHNNASKSPSKSNGSTSNNSNGGNAAIVKRSSILAADVSAYQLLKQQTKKGKGVVTSGSPSSVVTPAPPSSAPHHQTKVVVVKGAPPASQPVPPRQHEPQMEDAFSESSDDLSDNAITRPEHSSSSGGKNTNNNNSRNDSSNSSAGGDNKGGSSSSSSSSRVRIAGQGIRMVPNGTRKVQKNNSNNSSSSSTSASKSGGSSSAPPPKQSPSRNSATSSSTTSTFSSYHTPPHHSSSSSSSTASRTSLMTMIKSDPVANASSEEDDDVWSDCHQELPPVETKKSKAMMNVTNYKSQNGQKTTNHHGVVMNVASPVNEPQMSSLGRATFITFEAVKEPPKKTKSASFEEMEFEEYQFDKESPPPSSVTVSVPPPAPASSNENVVSLSVPPRNPLAQTNGSGSGAGTYIKHSKGQQSSSGKFGALRRRKSRSGPNNPGKLLQETIYEEEPEPLQEDHQTQGGGGGGGGKEHSVKIMVSPAPPPLNTEINVKPILKNRERTYETPVVVATANNNNNAETTTQQNGGHHLHQPEEFSQDQQIYFDSSFSTLSTASKKKVQFDQSKVVVCGGDSSAGDSYDDDDDNDDSDQWSIDKSDEEEESPPTPPHSTQIQQRPSSLVANANANSPAPPPIATQHQAQSSVSPVEQEEKATKPRARSSFEEEVARKAAQFAKSREIAAAAATAAAAASAKRKQAEAGGSGSGSDVNNPGGGSGGGAAVVVYGGEHRTGGRGEKKEQQQQKMCVISSAQEEEDDHPPVVRNNGVAPIRQPSNSHHADADTGRIIMNGTSGGGSLSSKSGHGKKYNQNGSGAGGREVMPIQFSSEEKRKRTTMMTSGGKNAEMFDNKVDLGGISSSNRVVLNPNSLLFHDTTRIRLNQSRPALHENTFKLGPGSSPTNQGGKSGGQMRVTRLKQSNSFRSVSSVPLRPKEPPPPPPTASSNKSSGNGLSSMPARLQKALSTSTLLSKSTEKLALASSLTSSSSSSSSKSITSIYGPGGRLLPSKSQISLPLGFTTTSNQVQSRVSAGGGSVPENLHVLKSALKNGGVKTNIRAKGGASSGGGAGGGGSLRSKSLTEKCDQLEKVLSLARTTEDISFSSSNVRSPLLSKPNLLHPNTTSSSSCSALDIDSKNIEIVTKENEVSEIRIYSSATSTSSSPLGIHPHENLPYQGIIYESSKTLITAEVEEPKKVTPVALRPPTEIHYAATDLFPGAAAAASSSFAHPPLPPLPSNKTTSGGGEKVEQVGKSVVLIIDNNNHNANNSSNKTPPKKESPLTYSQPIDTIPATKAPQIPLPLIPTEDTYSEEPLYDDVINHSEQPTLPLPPPPVGAKPDPSKLKGGSLGRKSLNNLLTSSKVKPLAAVVNKQPLLLDRELPPLPPPPVPPHRVPLLNGGTIQGQGTVVSSTLPCPACPPSLPPPNLPSKNLSEFHNRPIVIQEGEDDQFMSSSGFPPTSSSSSRHTPQEGGYPPPVDMMDDDFEVDNLYNDIGSPQIMVSPAASNATSSAAAVAPPLKSSTAAAFASAMKEAFLGALKRDRDSSDRRSVISTNSNCSGGSSQDNNHKNNLIYDDTLSIISSSSTGISTSSTPRDNFKGSSNNINNNNNNNNPSRTSFNNKSMGLNNKNAGMNGQQEQQMLYNPVIMEESSSSLEENEPLYDDVLNISQKKAELEKKSTVGNATVTTTSGGGDQYHSSNSSDSGTEDLPPPLPAQGPPPLPKSPGELPLFTFPLQGGAVVSSCQPACLVGATIIGEVVTTPSKKPEDKSEGGGGEGGLSRTRSLLTELNEKLSKLSFPPEDHHQTAVVIPPPGGSSVGGRRDNKGGCSASSPGSSSLSSTDGGHPSSSSNNSNGGDGGDEFSTYISKVVISPSSESSGVEEDYNSEKNYSLSNSSEGSSSAAEDNYKLSAVSKLVSETISLARGKFLENMKLSMLGGGGGGHSSTPPPTSEGLLMMSSSTSQQKSSDSSSKRKSSSSPEMEVDPEEEPIYEEIGDRNHHLSHGLLSESSRSNSPLYADAFDAKSMFDGASRSEILSFLESIRDRLTGAESTTSSESQSSSISSKKAEKLVDDSSSVVSSSPLTPSKILEEVRDQLLIKAPPSSPPKLLCPDCNILEEELAGKEQRDGVGGLEERSQLCRSCNRKRNEKREIIMEIYETELKYGRDLRIILEEFYKPIQIAGLLAKEHLDQIFLNVDELIQINFQLTCRLKQAISAERRNENESRGEGENAGEEEGEEGGEEGKRKQNGGGGDEDLLSDVNVGKIFLQLGEMMMTAFENYCTRQASAGALLSQLEKEKELLRIFLRVSQMENTVLRRMNLPAFLMVPVQRVTRYPLLLSRLLKVTPVDHFSREELQSAQEKIEQHLEHMNKTTREVASVKLWRRISIINGNNNNSNNAPSHRRSNSDLDASNIRIRKMAMDVMDWSNFNDVTCVIDNQLGLVHFNGKALRNIYGCLLARGKDLDLLASKMDQDLFFPPASEDVVKDVKLVLVRVKNTRFCLLREPLCLSKCVVSQGENEFQDFIEINEITTKNTYFIQGLDKPGTASWLKFLQCYSSCVGYWRRRRPALANIMMNGMAIKHL